MTGIVEYPHCPRCGELLELGHRCSPGNGDRPSWEDYFDGLARLVATRATCPRAQIGAVIVDWDNRIVATGYNGAPSGLPHCTDVGCLLKDIDGKPSCIRTLHAESNAIDFAGSERLRRTSIYCTVMPCFDCAKRIVNAGIARVYAGGWYHSRNTELTRDYFKEAGVDLVI